MSLPDRIAHVQLNRLHLFALCHHEDHANTAGRTKKHQDEAVAISDEAVAISDEAVAISDEAVAISDEAVAISDEARHLHSIDEAPGVATPALAQNASAVRRLSDPFAASALTSSDETKVRILQALLVDACVGVELADPWRWKEEEEVCEKQIKSR
ncbi:hypothetical protein HIM_02002 [Hirsutella minnesotensis 3608]|nr:hypothetical protein HIM_02002 [Hirsutella minnesotensis 3608]